MTRRSLVDEERFVRLVDGRLRSGFHLAGYLLGDACEAEDAVQDSIERAWRAWSDLRDEASFAPWFDRILVNVCRDRSRRGRQHQTVQMSADFALHAPDSFGAIYERDALGRSIRALPVDQRTVVVLRFWRDLSIDQIAELLAVPTGTVKSRLHYGLESIRGAIAAAAIVEGSR